MNAGIYKQARSIYKVARDNHIVRTRRVALASISRAILSLNKSEDNVAVPYTEYNWLAKAFFKFTDIKVLSRTDLNIIEDLADYLQGKVG